MKAALLACALLAAAPAFADAIKSPEELARIRAKSRYEGVRWPTPTWAVTPRFGVALGDLGPAIVPSLEVSYAPGLLDKRLFFGLELSGKTSSLKPNRDVDAAEAALAFVATYRAWVPTSVLAGVGSVGAGAFARHVTTAYFGDRDERELQPTAFASLGLAVPVGPGELELLARATWARSQTHALHGSSVVPYSATLGYLVPIH